MIDHSEYAHENSRIFKLKQNGSTIFRPGISKRQGVHKVPFALNFHGKIVSREEAQKYYSYSKGIERILATLKNGKDFYTTFWAQVYYIKSRGKFAINLVHVILNVFSLYIFTFLEFPLVALCPDCHGEIIFDFRKIPLERLSQNFFVHKNILCKFTEKSFTRITKIMSLSESWKELLQQLIDIPFTEEELRKKL